MWVRGKDTMQASEFAAMADQTLYSCDAMILPRI